MAGVGHKLVAALVEHLQLFGHRVEGFRQAAELAAALDGHAHGQVASPHALDAARERYDGPRDHARKHQRDHHGRPGSNKEIKNHFILQGEQPLHRALHGRGQQQHPDGLPVLDKPRRGIGHPLHPLIEGTEKTQDVQRCVFALRLVDAVILRLSLGQDAGHLRQFHAGAVELALAVGLHLAAHVQYHQARAQLGRGGLQPLLQRLRLGRQVQRRKFLGKLIGAGAVLLLAVVEQIIAHQPDERGGYHIVAHPHNEQEGEKNFPADGGKRRVNPYR